MKKALIFEGGWDGHEPKLVSARFAALLEKNGFSVAIHSDMDCLSDLDALLDLDLIIPCWTMGQIDRQHSENVAKAVGAGVGLAGCHGGMCDAFRNDTQWQFMTGGQWVSHPGGDGISYRVHIKNGSSPITEGLEDFDVCSEQYYVHVDPAIEVLATTRFPLVAYYNIANGQVSVPVVWTKRWGNGRVFYCSLGHHDDVFDKSPTAQVLMERGMLWAADGKRIVRELGLGTEAFESNAKMY